MNGRERVIAMIEGRRVDHLPLMPITMMFAADQIGVKYKQYATDYRTLVEGQLRTAERFGCDQVSCISDPAREVTDLGDVALLPGLVNAHTHLELSWMRGLNPPSSSMNGWIRSLMALRKQQSPAPEEQARVADTAIGDAVAAGTIAFGDISNTLLTASVLASRAVPAVVFHELLGFAPHDHDGRAREGAERVIGAAQPPVRAGLAPHAPYSTSPELFRAIRAAVDASSSPILKRSSSCFRRW